MRPGSISSLLCPQARPSSSHQVAVPLSRPGSHLRCRRGWKGRSGRAPGSLDADYRGEVHVILINLGHDSFAVERGARIAQLVLVTTMQIALLEAASLDDTERGIRGFGSTDTGK
jgi:dUTP pyrophosphatase